MLVLDIYVDNFFSQILENKLLLFQDSNKDTNALFEILKFIEKNYVSIQCSEILLTCQKYFKLHANKILSIKSDINTTSGLLFLFNVNIFSKT